MVLYRRNTLFTAEPSHKSLEGSVNVKHSINSCLLTGHVGIHLQCQHPGNGSRRIAEWVRPAWSTHTSLHEGEAFCMCPGSVGVHVCECVHACVYVHCASVCVCMCVSVYMCASVCACV